MLLLGISPCRSAQISALKSLCFWWAMWPPWRLWSLIIRWEPASLVRDSPCKINKNIEFQNFIFILIQIYKTLSFKSLGLARFYFCGNNTSGSVHIFTNIFPIPYINFEANIHDLMFHETSVYTCKIRNSNLIKFSITAYLN